MVELGDVMCLIVDRCSRNAFVYLVPRIGPEFVIDMTASVADVAMYQQRVFLRQII